MKTLLTFLFIITGITTVAQQQTFDITTYTIPKGWSRQATESTVQFTKEDAVKGSYCIIMLFKSLPGSAKSKENFNAAWEAVVKEMVKISAAPTMQPAVNENGWEAQSGYAAFQSDETNGVALLTTTTGFGKMINILILTNSDTYEKEMNAFLESVSFKKVTPAANNTGANTVKPVQPNTTAKKDGFTFTTTNFDDGWTSTVQEDWVEVTKGNIKVLIHYPNKNADAYNSVLLEGLKNAWNILVAPRYSSASNFEFKPVTGWQSIEFAEADMVEKGTNKSVHVVLFKMNYSNGNGRYLEFITADKKSYEQEFGVYHQESYGWEKLEKMASYNKFAVAASDLTGKWTNDFSGAIQYVNASTGFDSHMATHASVENFQISAANTYNWDLGVASGNVGNIKFQSRKSSGKLSMTGNWKVNFSDIEGKPRTYNAYFSCIKGLRILWLDDRGFAKIQ